MKQKRKLKILKMKVILSKFNSENIVKYYDSSEDKIIFIY